MFIGNQQVSRSANIPAVLSETAKNEYAVIATSMVEMLDARLSDNVSC